MRAIPIVLHKITERPLINFEDVSCSLLEAILGVSKECQSVQAAFEFKKNFEGTILTFDDGHESDYELVLPALLEAQATATFFIVPNNVGQQGYMGWNQIRELHKAGMEIGSHSTTHKDFRNLNFDEAFGELCGSREIIQNKLGAKVSSFAFPYGFARKRHLDAANLAGYRYVWGSHHGVINKYKEVILPRNSVHSGTTFDQIKFIVEATRKQRFYWAVEDFLKPGCKHLFRPKTYRLLRNLIVKLRANWPVW